MDGFADRLKELNPGQPRGWQAELAKFMGVSKPTVSEWASGAIARIQPAHLFKLADHYRVHVRWLALGVGPKWLKESAYIPPSPVAGLGSALAEIHEAAASMEARQRSELRKLFDLYLEDPIKYKKLLPDIETCLSGEIAAATSVAAKKHAA